MWVGAALGSGWLLWGASLGRLTCGFFPFVSLVSCSTVFTCVVSKVSNCHAVHHAISEASQCFCTACA